MINTLIPQIENAIQQYGAAGVLAAGFLEELIAPIPSSLVATLGGFFLVPQNLSFLQALGTALVNVALPMSVGITLGSLLFYGLAHVGGKPLIQKYGKFFGLSWDTVLRLHAKWATKHTDEYALLVARALPMMPSVALSVVCGAIRYPLKTFIILTVVGAGIRSTLMAMVGWYVRDAYVQYAALVDKAELWILMIVGGVLVGFLIVRLLRSMART